MLIWDGSSNTRPDPTVQKGPDGSDWKRITCELQATQKFVANLAENVNVMPNLLEEITARSTQIQKLQTQISLLTAPKDLRILVKTLSAKMLDLSSIYSHAAEVLETVQLLQRQILNLGRRVDLHMEETKRWQVSMENRSQTWQRANEDRWNKRLQAVEEQLGAVSLALGMKSFGA